MEQLIVILETEVEAGILTQSECNNYVDLLLRASKQVFHNHPEYHEEVLRMTSCMIKLPSMEIRELKQAIAEKDSTIAEKDSTIAERDAAIAEKDSTIAELQRRLKSLQSN